MPICVSQPVRITELLHNEISNKTAYRWLSARLQYFQCASKGDTAVLHQTIDIGYWNRFQIFRFLFIYLHQCNRLTEFLCNAEISNKTTYRWLSARLQYLQCVSNGDTTVLHCTSDIGYSNRFQIFRFFFFLSSYINTIEYQIGKGGLKSSQ